MRALILVSTLFCFASCSDNSITARTSAMIQAKQFQIDIAGFRGVNSGRYPGDISELVTFLSTADGFFQTNSHFVYNDKHRGLSGTWIYNPPTLSHNQISVIFQSPEKVDGRFIIGLTNGELREVDVPTFSEGGGVPGATQSTADSPNKSSHSSPDRSESK